MSTPHGLDTYINAAATRRGSPQLGHLLQLVGMQESGLGVGGDYDAATGRSRTAGNLGVSPWQIDPHSFSDFPHLTRNEQAIIERARTDPTFAAYYTSGMLRNALHEANGDPRKALAIFHSGAAHWRDGLTYADQVLSRNLEPLHQAAAAAHVAGAPAPPSWWSSWTQDAQQHGVSAAIAAHVLPGTAHFRRTVAQLATTHDWAAHHPTLAGVDLLSLPQRALAAVLTERNRAMENQAAQGRMIPNGRDIPFLGALSLNDIHALGNEIFHQPLFFDASPHAQQHYQLITRGGTRPLFNLMGNAILGIGRPLNETIIHAVGQQRYDQVAGPLQKYVLNSPFVREGGQASEDLFSQVVEDPLTYIPGADVASTLEHVAKAFRIGRDGLQSVIPLMRAAAYVESHGGTPLLTHFRELFEPYMRANAHLFRGATDAARGFQEYWDLAKHQVMDVVDPLYALKRTFSAFGAGLVQRANNVGRDIGQRMLGEHEAAVQQGTHAVQNAFLRTVYRFSSGAARRSVLKHAPADLAEELQRSSPVGHLFSLGKDGVSRTVERIAAMSPDEQRAFLAQMRARIMGEGSARQLHQMLQDPAVAARMMKPGVAVPHTAEEMYSLLRSAERDPLMRHIRGVTGLTGEFLGGYRAIQRWKVSRFPWVHGIGNLGQLAYLGFGHAVVPWALHYAANGLTEEEMNLIRQAGVAPTFIHPGMHEAAAAAGSAERFLAHAAEGGEQIGEQAAQELRSAVQEGGTAEIGGVYGGAAGRQGFLEHEYQRWELAWRMAAYRVLEQHLGKSTSAYDDLVKGAIIAERIGDPLNQSGLVRFFQMLGGPFVAYRLGIVPHNVLRAVRENPARVLALTRPPATLQRDRPASSRNKNWLQVGGPTTDAAENVFDPARYYASPATMGLPGVVAQEAYSHFVPSKAQGAATHYGTEADRWFNPYSSWTDPLATAAGLNPGALPGEHMTLGQQMFVAILQSFATHFIKEEKPSMRKANLSKWTKYLFH